MGKLIYVDFQERKRVNDVEVRTDLIISRFETYKKIAAHNFASAIGFTGILQAIAAQAKGK